ncbi:protein lev-9 [Caerostris extrusa]|uniref:Protein lev-9 n=1 Tax=Caerostris extrusa TaxID=172846 RepID=A0AAV4UUR7_CAEEX|nr:protein lev-9 [Caerostris extrusa]
MIICVLLRLHFTIYLRSLVLLTARDIFLLRYGEKLAASQDSIVACPYHIIITTFIGSTAAFQCLPPRVRTGVSHTTCRKGEWVDPVPTCTFPSCTLDSLFEIVPENVVPIMDNINSDTLPFNFTLQLTCQGGLRISDIETAKCGSEGSWQISRVLCVSGCSHPLKTELLVEPDKDFYRFGRWLAVQVTSSARKWFGSCVWVLLGYKQSCRTANKNEGELMELKKRWIDGNLSF